MDLNATDLNKRCFKKNPKTTQIQILTSVFVQGLEENLRETQATAQRLETHLKQKEKLYEDKIKVRFKGISLLRLSPNVQKNQHSSLSRCMSSQLLWFRVTAAAETAGLSSCEAPVRSSILVLMSQVWVCFGLSRCWRPK